MADAYQEVTSWKEPTPNHVYLLESDKALGYIKEGTSEPFYFSKPLQIDKRYRKFVKLAKNPFKVIAVVDKNLVAVTGSKGDTYYVNVAEKTCTCPGYGFRGKCKHVESI